MEEDDDLVFFSPKRMREARHQVSRRRMAARRSATYRLVKVAGVWSVGRRKGLGPSAMSSAKRVGRT